jgi:hypothetical protein
MQAPDDWFGMLKSERRGPVAELVDALDLGSSTARCPSSSLGGPKNPVLVIRFAAQRPDDHIRWSLTRVDGMHTIRGLTRPLVVFTAVSHAEVAQR